MLRCTERDKRVVAKCALCRWLTTSQIRRMYFPSATVNAVQKRLRKLAEEGYLRTHRESILSETLHGLGPKGKAIVEGKGLNCIGTTEVPRQVAHFTGVNDVRMAVETGIVPVAYFFANWQFVPIGWQHPVIPDAVFALRTPALRTFVVEFDRATEGLGVLVAKLRAYQEGLPGFSFAAVLIVTERERALDGLKREAGKQNISLRVLVGTLADLQSKGIDECSFFELQGGGSRKLLDMPLQSGRT
jgi:protein involved in plasmid replication-relaxation